MINGIDVLIVLLLAAVAVYEWHRHRRRGLALRKNQSDKPPFSWPVVVPSARGPYDDSPDLPPVARALRETDSGVAAYLVLIERAGFADHQASLADDLVEALARHGVPITRFYHDGDPRICFGDSQDEPSLLVELRRKYPTHRLILVGSGSKLIDPVTGRLYTWVEALVDWRERVLLTPIPVTGWDLRERALARHFIVSPESIDGLRTAVESLGVADRDGATTFLPDATAGPPGLDATNTVSALRDYLGRDAFQWLCACAIYPELHWDLTLFIGALPVVGDKLVNEETVTRLTRLPWFRTGVIPDDIRLALIGELRPQVAGAVRSSIVNLLEQSPAPSGSAAAPRYRLNVVVQQLLASGSDKENRRVIMRKLENLPPREITRDWVFLRLLEKLDGRHLAMVLPEPLRRAFYRYGVPAFGLTPVARMSAAAGFATLTFMMLPTDRLSSHSSFQMAPDVATAPDTTSIERFARADSVKGRSGGSTRGASDNSARPPAVAVSSPPLAPPRESPQRVAAANPPPVDHDSSRAPAIDSPRTGIMACTMTGAGIRRCNRPLNGVYIAVGDSMRVAITPTNQTRPAPVVRWTSDNPNVLSVTPDGSIVATGNGSTTIRATLDGGATMLARVDVGQARAAAPQPSTSSSPPRMDAATIASHLDSAMAAARRCIAAIEAADTALIRHLLRGYTDGDMRNVSVLVDIASHTQGPITVKDTRFQTATRMGTTITVPLSATATWTPSPGNTRFTFFSIRAEYSPERQPESERAICRLLGPIRP